MTNQSSKNEYAAITQVTEATWLTLQNILLSFFLVVKATLRGFGLFQRLLVLRRPAGGSRSSCRSDSGAQLSALLLVMAAPLVCRRLGEKSLLPGKAAGLLPTSSSSLLAETLSREGNIFQVQEKQQREPHRGTADVYTTAPSLLSTVQRQWRRLRHQAATQSRQPSLQLHT